MSLLYYFLCAAITEAGHFYGGSMSFKTYDHNGHYQVKLRLLTGWVLTEGPCGRNCTEADVGISTNRTRRLAIAAYNESVFGDWGLELGQGNNTYITDEVNDRIEERVQAVNQKLGWELDAAEVLLDVPGDTDIVFEGIEFVHSKIQPTLSLWHLQVKLWVNPRTDTMKPNSSPVVLVKPFYRLGINREYNIHIPATDDDGDHVECRSAIYVEFLGFKDLYPYKNNIRIQKNCVVTVSTKTKFQVNDTLVIGVMVEDKPRRNVELIGSNSGIKLWKAYENPLSSISVQFYVSVVDHVPEPEFLVPPTPENNKMFIVYVGVPFFVKLYAAPTDINGLEQIKKFTFQRRDGEDVLVSNMKDAPSHGARTKMVEVTWLPTVTEVGDHILSALVVDTAGTESVDMHSFVIRVKEYKGNSHQSDFGKIHFVDFPRKGEIQCESGGVCRFPVYATSNENGGIANITVLKSEIPSLFVVKFVKPEKKTADRNMKMAVIEVRENKGDGGEVCFKASDRTMTISSCTNVIIVPKDPCQDNPCNKRGTCLQTKNSPGFYCLCNPQFTGDRCQTKLDKCKPNPCQNGAQCQSFGIMYYCFCPSQFTGRNCDHDIKRCDVNTCGNNSVCEDTKGTYTCHCIQNYTGSNCGKCYPKCIGHGICVTGPPGGVPACGCSLEYNNKDCSSLPLPFSNLTEPMFVAPTPGYGAEILCDTFKTSDCQFPVYIEHTNTSFQMRNVFQNGGITAVLGNPVFTKVGSVNGFGLKKIYMMSIKPRVDKNVISVGENTTIDICFTLSKKSSPNIIGDSRCFSVRYYNRALPKSGYVKPKCRFTPPTPIENSIFTCVKGQPCHYMLYTVPDISGSCMQVVAPENSIYGIFTTKEIGQLCQTELVVPYTNITGVWKICSKACAVKGESRCFNLNITEDIQDPCRSNPCLHGGICQTKSPTSYVCHCPKEYRGEKCQKGPCAGNTTRCLDDGFCFTDGFKESCFCQLGYYGQFCQKPITLANKTNAGRYNHSMVHSAFVDLGIPPIVSCYRNGLCTIPLLATVNSTHGCVRPSISHGYVDPDVYVDDIKTERVSTSCNYQTTVTTISNTTGLKTLCLQDTMDDKHVSDEICIQLNFTNGVPKPINKNKAYFVSPTLPTGLEVQCTVDEPCHLGLWMSNRDGDIKCPGIKASLLPDDGVYIFRNDSSGSPCAAQVVFNSTIQYSYNICFTLTSEMAQQRIGGDGETRCYKLYVRNDISVRSPCIHTVCLHGGFCDGYNKGRCVCRQGFSGQLCEIEHGVPQSNASRIQGNNFQSIGNLQSSVSFGDLGLPDTILCELRKECVLPMSVIDKNKSCPSLRLDGMDSDLYTVPNKPGCPSNNTYLTNFTIIPERTGKHRACIQLTTGTVNDEVCFNVIVPKKDSLQKIQSQPHFVPPTLPDESILTCSPHSTCHLILYPSSDITDKCPLVIKSKSEGAEIHLFQRNKRQCRYDVAIYQMDRTSVNASLCFETHFPSIPGEKRCFTVLYKYPDTDACMGQTCGPYGFCTSLTLHTYHCVCSLGRIGQHCDMQGFNRTLSNGNGNPTVAVFPPTFIDGLLPDVIPCHVNEICHVPFVFKGPPNLKPKISSSSNILRLPHKIVRYPTMGNDTYIASLEINSTTQGSHEVCVELNSGQGVTGDIMCFLANVTGPCYANCPQQGVSSFPDESVVTCSDNTTCHLLINTPVGHNKNACDVCSVQQTVIAPASQVVRTTLHGNNCFTDLATFMEPGQHEKTICFKTSPTCLPGTYEKRCVVVKNNRTYTESLDMSTTNIPSTSDFTTTLSTQSESTSSLATTVFSTSGSNTEISTQSTTHYTILQLSTLDRTSQMPTAFEKYFQLSDSSITASSDLSTSASSDSSTTTLSDLSTAASSDSSTTTLSDLSTAASSDSSTTTLSDLSTAASSDSSTTTLSDLSTAASSDSSTTTLSDLSTAASSDSSTTTLSDLSTAASSDSSTTTLSDLSTTASSDSSTTTLSDLSTAASSDSSTTTLSDLSTMASSDSSTTTSSDLSTTASSDSSTTASSDLSTTYSSMSFNLSSMASSDLSTSASSDLSTTTSSDLSTSILSTTTSFDLPTTASSNFSATASSDLSTTPSSDLSTTASSDLSTTILSTTTSSALSTMASSDLSTMASSDSSTSASSNSSATTSSYLFTTASSDLSALASSELSTTTSSDSSTQPDENLNATTLSAPSSHSNINFTVTASTHSKLFGIPSKTTSTYVTTDLVSDSISTENSYKYSMIDSTGHVFSTLLITDEQTTPKEVMTGQSTTPKITKDTFTSVSTHSVTTSSSDVSTTPTVKHKMTPGTSSSTSDNVTSLSRSQETCPGITAMEAKKAADEGRVICTCVQNGKTQVIRITPKVTTTQLLKAAGAGIGSVIGAISIATVLYIIVKKVQKQEICRSIILKKRPLPVMRKHRRL